MMATHPRTAVDGTGKMLYGKLARLLEDWEQNVAALRRVVRLVNGSNGQDLANASRTILADALALDRTRAERHNGNGNGTAATSDGNGVEPSWKDRKARVRSALAALPDVAMSTVELKERGVRGVGPLVRNGFLKKTSKGYRPTAKARAATTTAQSEGEEAASS